MFTDPNVAQVRSYTAFAVVYTLKRSRKEVEKGRKISSNFFPARFDFFPSLLLFVQTSDQEAHKSRKFSFICLKQDAYWHFRVMLLNGLIIPIVLASQIFKAVSLLRDFSQKDCVILRHNNGSSLPAEMFGRLLITLLDLVPELNLDLSKSCSIQSFRIKHEVMFLTNSFLCSSVPTVRLYPPFLCYSLSTKN